jgi:hypothetical protein
METKKCPSCGKEILAVAQKCKHCGEWIKGVSAEETSHDHIGELTQENAVNRPYQYATWMVWLCYTAMFFAIAEFFDSVGFENKVIGGGSVWNVLITITTFIPKYISTLCNTVLEIILLWHLKSYLGQKQNVPKGLFITLLVLSGLIGLGSLLTDGYNDDYDLGLFGLCFIAYPVIMLIIGIKLSKTTAKTVFSVKTAFIVYSIVMVVGLLATILGDLDEDEGWEAAILALVLNLYFLWSIKSEFFNVKTKEEDE